MALTLTEAAKLSNDVVLQGVVETVVKESRILDVMPFVDIVGNALTYNRENAMATAAFYEVGYLVRVDANLHAGAGDVEDPRRRC